MSSSSKKKVYACITAYDCRTDILNMFSVMTNVKVLEVTGYNVDLRTKIGNCYIDKSRNEIATEFLSLDVTDMFFIDNDLHFQNDAMLKLLSLPYDVVGAAYPFRTYRKNGYTCGIKMDDNGVPIGDKNTGAIECDYVPTGLIRVTRRAYQKLIDTGWFMKDNIGVWDFFRTGILWKAEGNNHWYGEDVAFCKYCNLAGIKTYVYPNLEVEHIGRMEKHGNFHHYLLENGRKGEEVERKELIQKVA